MQLELVYSSTNWSTSGVTRGQGSCPRAQQARNTKQHQQNILWITNTKVCVIKIDELAKCCLSQRTFASLISSLLGIGYSIALHSILLSGLVAPPKKSVGAQVLRALVMPVWSTQLLPSLFCCAPSAVTDIWNCYLSLRANHWHLPRPQLM